PQVLRRVGEFVVDQIDATLLAGAAVHGDHRRLRDGYRLAALRGAATGQQDWNRPGRTLDAACGFDHQIDVGYAFEEIDAPLEQVGLLRQDRLQLRRQVGRCAPN